MRSIVSRIFSHPITPLILWMALIFSLSALPGSGSGIEPPLWYVLERKSAHVFEYAVLMLLSFRFFRAAYRTESPMRLAVIAAAFSLMYASTDELHQFFVFGRGAKLTDVAIDGLGIMLAAGAMLALQYRRRIRK